MLLKDIDLQTASWNTSHKLIAWSAYSVWGNSPWETSHENTQCHGLILPSKQNVTNDVNFKTSLAGQFIIINKEIKLLPHSAFCATKNCWMSLQDVTYFTPRESNALENLLTLPPKNPRIYQVYQGAKWKGSLAPFLPGPCFQRIPPSALGSQCW